MEKWKTRDRLVRAFSLPAVVRKHGATKALRVPRNQVVADQGSDINLIYPDLVRHLGLSTRPTHELDLPPIKMTMPDGTQCSLKKWVNFMITVDGIEREVWAFVCPTQGRRISLLLGVPYLESVDAHIRVRDSTIDIGDVARSEEVRTIESCERESMPVVVEPETVEEDDESTEEEYDAPSSDEFSTSDNDSFESSSEEDF